MLSQFSILSTTLQSSPFFDMGLMIITATFLAYLGGFIKQPKIPLYILAGLIIGPLGMNLVTNSENVRMLAEMGIAFLLFIVGLDMSLKKLKSFGSIAVYGGALQCIITFLITLFITKLLGFDLIASIYISLVITFSSTMIVIKLLSDEGNLNTVHGRIMVGILLVQDLFAILALSLLNTLENISITFVAMAFLKGLLLIILSYLIAKFVVPSLFQPTRNSKEIFFLSALSICFLYMFLAYSLGFSIAIGAFLAGLSLASFPYHTEIITKINPLRDFFSTLFFVSMGIQVMDLNVKAVIAPLAIFLFLTIILKPLIIMTICNIFGYEKRTFFFSGIFLGQISEFSLILVLQGLFLGHINNEIFSLTVLLLIISVTITSYLAKHHQKIYLANVKWLSFFDALFPSFRHVGPTGEKIQKKSYILFGCDRMGKIILKNIEKLGKDILIMDNNPEIVEKLLRKKEYCFYGDATNEELLKKIDFKHAQIVISTLPDFEDNKFILKYAKSQNKNIKVIVNAKNEYDAIKFYEGQADYVIIPLVLSGEYVAKNIADIIGQKESFKGLKRRHLRHLLEEFIIPS